MTRTRRGIGLVFGLGALAAGTMAVLTACGGDDTVVIVISDSGATDGTVPPSGDSGPVTDASTDSPVITGDDGPGDDTTDSGDDTSTDAGPDAMVFLEAGTNSAQVAAFTNSLATTYCSHFAAACNATDAGPFDMNLCDQFVAPSILEGSSIGLGRTEVLKRDDLSFDSAAAARCLADVASLNFADVASAAYLSATADCFAAVHGTLPIGATCLASVECSPGEYCKNGAPDGGALSLDAGPDGGLLNAGTCERLENANTNCANYQVQGDSCSYLGSQANNAFCDELQSTPVCVTGLLPLNTPCRTNLSCASGLCDPNATTPICVATAVFASGGADGICGIYQDAGH